MNCIRLPVVVLATLYFTTAAQPTYAQVTQIQALNAGYSAAEQIKSALGVKGNSSSIVSNSFIAEVVQIGRVIFYLNQMNAQQKSDSGKYIKEFLDLAHSAKNNDKSANTKVTVGVISFAAGVTFLFAGNATAAKDAFEGSNGFAEDAATFWANNVPIGFSLESKVQSLKNLVDGVAGGN